MNVKNEFTMNVDAKSVNEGFCRTAVSAFVTPLDPTIEELSDLKTAVSEAVTNSIVHGYREKCGKIYISVQILESNTVRITVKDRGVGIADVKQAMQPLFSTGEGDRAGLGFTVMQSFCDRVSVKSTPEKGTSVILTKRIHGKSKW